MLELAAPALASWGLPQNMFSVVPLPKESGADETKALNRATQSAADEVLSSPSLAGKIVVMVWEHHHIADRKLEKQYPYHAITLRQLLHLDRLRNVPSSWSGDNCDYFWIVFYDNPRVPIPTEFRMVRQKFASPFATVPANRWGEPENLPPSSHCE